MIQLYQKSAVFLYSAIIWVILLKSYTSAHETSSLKLSMEYDGNSNVDKFIEPKLKSQEIEFICNKSKICIIDNELNFFDNFIRLVAITYAWLATDSIDEMYFGDWLIFEQVI